VKTQKRNTSSAADYTDGILLNRLKKQTRRLLNLNFKRFEVNYFYFKLAIVLATMCSSYLEYFAIDPTCIDHYTRTVSEWTKDNTVSFSLRDMTRRFRDCLGR